jgi:tetratricopeptide (TPR) repeat protein
MQGGRYGEKGVNFLDNPLTILPPSLRILNALRVAWRYVGLHVYPATLSCDYSYNAILLYSNWRHNLPPLLATVAVLALWFWTIKAQRKEWFLAGAIYLVGFAVTANILVPTGTIMGERLAYLPSAGFCLLVALLWVILEERQRHVAWSLLAVVVLALGVRTVVRNRDWRDNYTLFASAVQAVPGSAKAHAGLGGEYLRRDRLEEAGREFRACIEIYPDFADVWDSLGLVEARLGHDREALGLFEKSLSMTPKDDINYDYVAVNLAGQLIKLGKTDDALKLLNDEIATSPEYSRAWANRAVIWYQRGDMAAARSDVQTALRLDPTNAQAQALLGVLNKVARG